MYAGARARQLCKSMVTHHSVDSLAAAEWANVCMLLELQMKGQENGTPNVGTCLEVEASRQSIVED